MFDDVFSWFKFNNFSIAVEFCRLGILLLLTILAASLVAFAILQFTKAKEHKIGFSNWFKVCFMYGCIAAIATLGIIAILTIRANGLYYFQLEAIGFSEHCGYLLMLPEIVLMLGWVTVYLILKKNIYKSIN